MALASSIVVAIVPIGLLSPGASLHPARTAAMRSRPGASTTATARRAASAAACSSPGSSDLRGPLTQSLDGHVSGCWLVGAQAPGVDDVGLGVTTPPLAVSTPALGPSVTVSLTPSSGAPGSRVTLRARVSVPLPASGVTQFADVCFDSCDGLTESGVALHWLTKPGGRVAQRFTATVLVPDAPWLVNGTPHGLVSGTYEIGVQCAGEEVGGCALGAAQGSAAFRLVVPRPQPCPTLSVCSSLHLTPVAAPPGTSVTVSGTAPLAQIIGQPFGYGLFDVGPNSGASGHGQVVVARQLFHVTADPPWSGISSTVPLSYSPAGPPPGPIAADGAVPGEVAWCDPSGSIELVSAKTGTATSTAASAPTIPTLPARAARLSDGMKLFSEMPRLAPSCTSVLPSPSSAATFYAVFDAAGPQGAPPVEQVGLVTTDSGRSWGEVPAPAGSQPDLISGFELGPRDSVEALFAPASPAAPGGSGSGGSGSGAAGRYRAPELVEASPAPGAPFRPASLNCPARGACLLLGPYSPGNCAMNENLQQLIVQQGGRLVEGGSSPLQVAPDTCAPSALAGTGASSALVVDSQSQFPLLETSDGGGSFVPVALPLLRLAGSGGPSVLGQGASYSVSGAGLVLLPSGALLATTSGLPDATLAAGSGSGPVSGHWELLAPHATRWCTTANAPVTSSAPSHPSTGGHPGRSAAPFLVGFVPLLRRLWWTATSYSNFGQATTSDLESTSLASLACAAG
ncbi:MAG TPA: hypothetical protein VMD59_23975 [Acidimicrobiales bacterium]|nr:hypothetical protein [Acidimicrobiales bacterium]